MLKSAVKPYNSGGTNAQAAVKIAIDELESVEHWYTRHIILLSDGDVNISEEYIQKAQDKKIKNTYDWFRLRCKQQQAEIICRVYRRTILCGSDCRGD